MNIKGKKVILRAVEAKDISLLHEWSNDPELWNLLCGWHFPYSLKSTEEWFQKINNNNATSQTFAICSSEDSLIGTTNLVDIDWKNRNAFHGMQLGNINSRGKGYGLDTVMAIMRYAFDELGLNRLDGAMICNNTISIKFYTEKCGWKIEGVKKEFFFRNGMYHDKVVVGITKAEYLEHLQKTKYWNE